MPSVAVPPAVQALIDATNAGDSEAFVALFSDDAYLEDFGREFHGPDGAASWDSTDNIGVGAHFELLDVRAGDGDGVYLVDLRITSGRFNGDSTLTIGVRDDRITRLVTG